LTGAAWEPPSELRIVDGLTDDAPSSGPTTWEPLDLAEALAGAEEVTATVLLRADGVGLLYPGRTHQFAGEPESLKTWAALLAVAQVVAAGGHVLWIDYEDDARGFVGRLRALAVPDETIIGHCTYLWPEEPLVLARVSRWRVVYAARGSAA